MKYKHFKQALLFKVDSVFYNFNSLLHLISYNGIAKIGYFSHGDFNIKE